MSGIVVTKGDLVMFFANLVGEKGTGTFIRSTRKNTVPFVNEVSDLYADVRVILKDGKITTEAGDVSEDIFMKDLVGEPTQLYAEKVGGKYTVSDLSDTEENPLIAVLSDGVKFYEGIPSIIKYIHVSEDLFVLCLIYGACEFKCKDGTFIPMSRNLSTDVSGKLTTSVYTDAKLREIASTVDDESDYDMAFDIVNAIFVDIKNEYVSRYKTLRENEFILSDTNLLEKRRITAEKKAAAEAAREAKREANRKFMEEQRAKAKQLEEEKKAEVEKQFAKPKKVKIATTSEGSSAAQGFLSKLRSMGYNG